MLLVCIVTVLKALKTVFVLEAVALKAILEEFVSPRNGRICKPPKLRFLPCIRDLRTAAETNSQQSESARKRPLRVEKLGVESLARGARVLLRGEGSVVVFGPVDTR